MFDYQIISRERHANKFWRKLTNYRFTNQDNIATLLASEAPTAMMWMPLAFLTHANEYVLVAVQGLKQGQNLFVNKDGAWLAGYIPAVYRGYPFKIAVNNDQEYICIDEQSGLLSEDGIGAPFYGEDGNASEQLQEYVRFLAQLKSDQKNTARLCQILASKGVIEEWPVRVDAGSVQTIGGLHRINEAKLNALPHDAFIELRDSGALLLAYCQLLSTQNLAQLAKLAAATQPRLESVATPQFNFNQNETISFSHLK